MPIIGMLIHPVYLLVNAATVGRIDDTMLAGLGLGAVTTGILLISVGQCFTQVTGSLVAPAFGEG